jgi:predicted PurR-regulated permease PerM
MKYRWDNRYLHWGVTAFLVIAASMLFYYAIFHMKSVIAGLRFFLEIIAPIIYGFAIAYLLNPIAKFFEEKLIDPALEKKNIKMEKRGSRLIRWCCVLLSMVLLYVLIYTLIQLILPQLIRSITNIIYSFPHYVKVIERWMNSVVEKGWNLDSNAIDLVNQYSTQVQNYLSGTLLPQMQDMLLNISSGVVNVITIIKNFLIGSVVALYLLADKELFIAKSKMMLYAVLPTERANSIIHAMRFTHKIFGGFISGKLLDSAIIGVLCYIGMTIFNMPYAILISVIIGVTNIIPFFGPYLGAIPSIFLILLVDPMMGLYFTIFIIVLQQFDGNILGPKILGDSTGLSSFMVIVAILVGGGFFGIAGMIVGVPIFAVVYASLNKFLAHSLRSKDIPAEEEAYRDMDCLDPETHEIRPMVKEPTFIEKHRAENRTLFVKVYTMLWEILKKLFAQLLVLLKKLKAFLIEKYKQVKVKIEEKKKQ